MHIVTSRAIDLAQVCPVSHSQSLSLGKLGLWWKSQWTKWRGVKLLASKALLLKKIYVKVVNEWKTNIRHEWDWVFDYPILFKCAEQDFKNIIPGQSHPVQSNKYCSCLFNKKYYCSMLRTDWWCMRMNEIYCSISFNLVYLIKSHLYWCNINKSCSKNKKQTHKIQLNLCKIQVLMRTNEMLWYKWDKTTVMNGK